MVWGSDMCPKFFLLIFILTSSLKDFIHLFLERGERREQKREKTSMCGCISCALYWGPGLQPRHVLWLRIELVTLRFISPPSIHWATPARVSCYFFKNSFLIYWFEREQDISFVVLLSYAFIGWFLYLPWLGINPTTLVYWDSSLTNWATPPGSLSW